MLIRESILMAFSALYAHKSRSILTMLGIIIGVASVIAIVAIGEGGSASLKTFFVGSGNNTFEVVYQSVDEEGNVLSDEPSEPAFEENALLALEKIPEIEKVIANNRTTSTLNYLDKTLMVQLNGTSESYFSLNNAELLSGRNIAAREFEKARKVALISEDTLKRLDPNDSMIGKIIELEGTAFKVIGTFKEQKSIFNVGAYQILIPNAVWPSLFGESKIDSLTIQVQSAEVLQLAGEASIEVLNSLNQEKHGQGEYIVLDMQQIQDSVASITRIMTAIIGSVASISLFVGGVGVMNIMLVSVTERTREIGIRKALGATRGNILTQFLIESVVLTTFGGIVGIGLGVGGAKLISLVTQLPLLVPMYVIVGGVLFSMLIGIVFGMLPANKASKWEPMDSLLFES
ncbi:ABC transporter permease [Paenibacillus sp. FSL H8-0537]|uniref:ABC transporter permease n=1 Tax=Paenibacillus sp. FSL H8-0537 TaxID=2921399 RepID=UPI003100F786